jgi:hypothetical protein
MADRLTQLQDAVDQVITPDKGANPPTINANPACKPVRGISVLHQ